MRVEHRSLKFQNRKEVELTLIQSNYHIELTPSNAGSADRLVCQELIKEMAQSHSLDSKHLKVVVLNEVDRMSKGAQAAMRRTMEKYTSSCRFILLAANSCNVIEPVRSRCIALRFGLPAHEEVVKVLHNVASKENIDLPDEFAMRIATESERNPRRAVLMLETARAKQYPFDAAQTVPKPDWEVFIAGIVQDILKEQSPQMLFKVRGKFYELLANCIPPDLIFRKLVLELVKHLDDELKHDITNWAAHFEHRMHLGNKAIFHLEAFAARVMALYKQWTIDFQAMFDD
jgi:replication factor C subunit 3/5